MKNPGLFLLCFILFFILSSAVMSQSTTPSPLPSHVQGEEQAGLDAQKKIIYITVIITLLIVISFVSFAVLRVRAKLKQADSHKKPVTGLASRNAGIIFDERSSDES
ncbi:MAG: hypothetical protein ABRQ39_01240 [Candidatus Eremiobacterota bacterium]